MVDSDVLLDDLVVVVITFLFSSPLCKFSEVDVIVIHTQQQQQLRQQQHYHKQQQQHKNLVYKNIRLRLVQT